MKKFKYISNLTISEIENNIVIPCIDELGNHSILIKNTFKKSVTTRFSTDNLNVQMDAILSIDDKVFYFHIISSTKKDTYSITQFKIIYEYVFKKIDESISGNELAVLIISLEEYFRITPDPNLYSLQVGVFGELFTIKYLYECGYKEIINKYHDNFYSKHDVEIDKKNRIEIKTTTLEKRIHRFKHNQIYRKDVNVFVASVMLEQSKEGLSLFDLFNEVENIYSNADSLFALKKLRKRCNIDEENHGLKFAIEKAMNDFKIFSAKKLPKIEMEQPNGVTNIKYDVDCSLTENINIEEFIKFLNSDFSWY